MSNIERLYSKVLIRVPSDYITTQRDGSLLIKCPTPKRSLSKKNKEMVDLPILSETKVITTPPTQIKSASRKFTKSSVQAIEHMAKMRAMRNKKIN